MVRLEILQRISKRPLEDTNSGPAYCMLNQERQRYSSVSRYLSTLYRVRLFALQPLSAENSAEFLHADSSKALQRRAMKLISLDFSSSWESIYVYSKQ